MPLPDQYRFPSTTIPGHLLQRDLFPQLRMAGRDGFMDHCFGCPEAVISQDFYAERMKNT